MEKEICNECGNNVKFGLGLFANRISDFNEYEDKLEMQKPFPEGEFICIECDEKLTQDLNAGNKRISN